MTPVRTLRVKATAYAIAQDTEAHPESHPNADLSSLQRLIFLYLTAPTVLNVSLGHLHTFPNLSY